MAESKPIVDLDELEQLIKSVAQTYDIHDIIISRGSTPNTLVIMAPTVDIQHIRPHIEPNMVLKIVEIDSEILAQEIGSRTLEFAINEMKIPDIESITMLDNNSQEQKTHNRPHEKINARNQRARYLRAGYAHVKYNQHKLLRATIRTKHK